MQRRKLDSEGKAGSIRGDRMSVGGQRSDASSELAAQLSRRSHILEEVCMCVCCVYVYMYVCVSDIPSDPPFTGWARIFRDRPAHPLTVLKKPAL